MPAACVLIEGLLGGELVDVERQSRLVTSRGIAMEDALLNGLIEDGDRCAVEGLRFLCFAMRERRTKLLHLSSQLGPIRGIDLVATCILTIPFLG